MNIVIGVVLCSAASILFAWGYAQHRRPVPAHWTRHGTLSSGLVLLVVGLLPAGLGPILYSVLNPVTVFSALGIADVLIMAAAVAAGVILTPMFLRAAHPVVDASTTPVIPTPANDSRRPGLKLAA